MCLHPSWKQVSEHVNFHWSLSSCDIYSIQGKKPDKLEVSLMGSKILLREIYGIVTSEPMQCVTFSALLYVGILFPQKF